MKNLVAIGFIFLIVVGCQKSKVQYPENLSQLHQNVISNILENSADSEMVENYLSEMKDDGSWPDIDYSSKERGGWPPAGHLSRLLEIAKAYQSKESEFHQNKNVSGKIHLALNFWLENDLICPNWWYPEIGVPRILNPIMILMEAELSEEQKEKGIKILNRSAIGMTGQNKVWQSGNVLLRNLLLKNEDTIRLAASSIQEELVVSTGEGVQPDWSYHQHGPQLQFGNYGLSYVTDMMKWIGILRKTPFQFEESKVKILRNYLLEGQQWIIWKDMYDISACGRQLFPNAQKSKAATLAHSLSKMEQLDPEFAEEYKKANNWQALSGNRYFWRSDFQVQRTPDYYFSVKMCSDRVIGAESCNSENLQGYYMGDGATFLYQTQKEYEDIFPFWDWKKIPGTTVHQDEEKLPVLTASGYRIESNFVGGVSDGEIGIAVMDYNRNGLKARKSWFMFDDMIVCLGAGIQSSEGLPVTTTLNQMFYNGEIDSQTISGNPGDDTFKWIYHNGIGYYFPAGSKIELTANMEKGSWNWVAGRYPEELIHSQIFKLWLDHGTNPRNESYQYVLVPNASVEKMNNLNAAFPFKIRNEKNRQEVTAVDGKVSGIVFYEPGKSEIFGGIEVDKPCIVLLKESETGIQLLVAEPTQLLHEINFSFSGKYKGKTFVEDGNLSNVKVDLPQESDAGKSVTIMLEKI